MRVLLKLSGEALKCPKSPLDVEKLDYVTDEIKKLSDADVEIAVLIGGGNISRGTLGEKWNISPVDSDINGMLATIVNAGWVSSVLAAKLGKEKVRKMVTVPSSYLGEMYSSEKAKSYLSANKIVVIGGGNGMALCTTDTAAVQRAIELESDCVIMLKNGVDGVYTEDPKKNKEAKRYKSMSFADLKKSGSKIVDESAAVMAAKYNMPMNFIDFNKKGAIVELCRGKTDVGTYVGDCETLLY